LPLPRNFRCPPSSLGRLPVNAVQKADEFSMSVLRHAVADDRAIQRP